MRTKKSQIQPEKPAVNILYKLKVPSDFHAKSTHTYRSISTRRKKMVSLMKALLAAVALVAVMEFGFVGANFLDQCNITWNPENAKMTEGGEHLTLSLVSNTSGNIQYVCLLACTQQCSLMD